ncbi:unnamed protein product [Lymnaea stagnalis]|uniref:NADH dehydrogenase [ubiquinone] 1 beta subcomplex subunit 2, mitochondrial n=1 Tax=Lymnaea stagnalis TaxID=6523 RepID=A0AAV2HPQ6_LYMST
MSLIFGRLRPIVTTLVRQNKIVALQQNSIRNSGDITYRGHVVSKGTKFTHYSGELLSFFLWYWILYHCWYDFDHLFHDSHFPDVKKLTNEELGIPPDDE